MQVIMVRRCRGSRQCGTRGIDVTPSIPSMQEGYNPHGDEQTVQGEICCGRCGRYDEILLEDVIGVDNLLGSR
jgi:hypothetical protein